MNDLSAIGNAVTLIAKGNKGDKAILNKDILSAAVSCVLVLETKNLCTTWRLV